MHPENELHAFSIKIVKTLLKGGHIISTLDSQRFLARPSGVFVTTPARVFPFHS